MDFLKELFYQQVNRIIANRFHLAAGLSQEDFINSYIRPLEQLMVDIHTETESTEDRIPILIVVPNNIVSLSYQLKSIRENLNDTQLEYIVRPEWFKNAEGVSTPDQPYLLLDVETGYAMLNTPPKKCVALFQNQGRLPLTIDEGLALIKQFPEVLESHWIDLPGSELIHKCAGQDAQQRGMLNALPPGFALATFVPTLYYKYYNSLRLYYVYEMTETPYSGSASCARRLAL
ncbi:MAG: hypothetical protein JRI57_00530 [Deltaproteobacteria bacterium]|nr:hypothetical protein [Deltaproteobacteria bacterium]MBW1951928.1 hypothetical protein [Deltaproteobacteria bacterium]MBW1986324.1 hypothetical protein [Deltaproteobacteria bacterium]MBW2134366.1 hypothetical protein [Deltaproteobacteria bacterium]